MDDGVFFSSSENACTLRALRKRMAELEEEMYRLNFLAKDGVIGSEIAREIVVIEYNCLAASVRKIWGVNKHGDPP